MIRKFLTAYSLGLALIYAPLCEAVPFGFWKAAASSAIIFSDNFTRPDENPLTDSGAWTTTGITGFGGVNFEISSHLASSNSGNAIAFVSTPSYGASANQKATITVTSATSVGPCVRLNASGNGYLVFAASSTQLQFYTITGGTTAQIGSNMTISALTSGNTVSLGIVGTTLTAYVNGVSAGTTTDATFSSGAPGMWSSGNGNTVSAFASTSL